MLSCFCIAIYDWAIIDGTLALNNGIKNLMVDLDEKKLSVKAKFVSEKSKRIDLSCHQEWEGISNIEDLDLNGNRLRGMCYINDKKRSFRLLFLSISGGELSIRKASVERFLTDLCRNGFVGYSIGFSSEDSEQALYHAMGITFGVLPVTQKQVADADRISRFFRQTTIADRNQRSYNIRSVRGIYELNVFNVGQWKIIESELKSRLGMSMGESHFIGNDHFLVSFDKEQSVKCDDFLAGSSAVI